MSRRKAPNTIDTAKAVWSVKTQLAWLDAEYAKLATQRNMFAFLYNQALASKAPEERASEKMREWQREAWRLEHIMRWIQEVYHRDNVKAAVQLEMKPDYSQAYEPAPDEDNPMGL